MRIGQAKGAQVGKGNTQNNTYLPAQEGARHSMRDSSSMSVTAGDNSTIHSTQTSKHTKFSIPVIGPLFSFASVHPVIAVTTAVVVVGGTGAVASGAMSDSGGSTGLTRGVRLTEADNGAPPLGYDFSQTPPAVAGPNADAIYVQQGFIYFTSGKLAHWTSATLPTASQCRDAVAKDPVRQVVVEVGGVTCYLDSHGHPGYFTITSSPMTGNYITVDTAHLS